MLAAWVTNYIANRQGDFAERDRKLAEAMSYVTHPGDVSQLRILAIRMRSEIWKTWPRPRLDHQAVLTGVGPLIDAREAWFNGDLESARKNLQRSRAEAIDSTGFREEAELLAKELGGPATLLRPDPPYPNPLRYLAIFDFVR